MRRDTNSRNLAESSKSRAEQPEPVRTTLRLLAREVAYRLKDTRSERSVRNAHDDQAPDDRSI
jgi:hypothetical protein